MNAAAASKHPSDMAGRIAAEQEADPLAHEWIVAAEVPVDTKTARRAQFRGSFRTEQGLRVDSLEVYCRNCRRPMDDVADQSCQARIDNTHLIGGDQSVRAKRKHFEPVGELYVPNERINRRGVEALVSGDGG